MAAPRKPKQNAPPPRPDHNDPQLIAEAETFLDAALRNIEQAHGLDRNSIGDSFRITSLLNQAFGDEADKAHREDDSVTWNSLYIIDRARWRAHGRYNFFVDLPGSS